MSDERSKKGPASRWNYWLIQAFDVAVTVFAFVLAFGLRTEFAFSDAHWLAIMVGMPAVAVVALPAYHAVGLFRGTWSQTADADLVVVVKGASLVSVLLIAGMVLTDTLSEIPRSVPLIHWFITVVALYGSRLLWARHQASGSDGHKSVAILIGCNQSALRFLSSIQALASRRFKIFGMLDDSPVLHRVGRTIRGTPVIGQVDRAEECLGQLSVHGVFPDRFVIMESFRRASPDRFAKLELLAQRANMTLDVINDSMWLDDSQGWPAGDPCCCQAAAERQALYALAPTSRMAGGIDACDRVVADLFAGRRNLRTRCRSTRVLLANAPGT